MALKKIGTELVCAVLVVLAGAAGGTYFYLKGEEPVKLVVAVRDIEPGEIKPADVKVVTLRRREIPSWLKAPDDQEFKSAWANVLVGDPSQLRGAISEKIYAGCYIFHSVGGIPNGPPPEDPTPCRMGPIHSNDFSGAAIDLPYEPASRPESR